MPALTSSKYRIKWKRLADLPIPLYCNCKCTAVQGHKIYVAGHNTANNNALEHVYEYNISTNHWNQLPNPGQYYGVPHIIGGKLCIIGGRLCKTKERTNKISTFNNAKRSWKPHYPDLLSARTAPGVITHLDYVIVAGGGIDSGDYHAADDIEVLKWTAEKLHWKRVSVHLPKPMINLRMTTCGECIFIEGYNASSRVWGNEKFKIAINAVINNEEVSWDRVTAESYRYIYTTPVPNSVPPLIIGGIDSHDQRTTADIKMYDVISKEWKKIASLASARSSPGVAMIGDNAIIVMGGHTRADAENFTASSVKIVEMGQVEQLL